MSGLGLRATAEELLEPSRPRLELDLGPDGGTFKGYVTSEEGPDAFQEFYRLTGLNPDEWVLDHGSLRVSMWQQSRRTDDGHRDIVWLRSYRGNLRRLSRPEITPADVTSLLQVARRHPRIRHKSASAATRVVLISDIQVGKVDANGGTPEMLERVGELLNKLGDVIATEPTERALLLDPGDLVEGFENTGSQAFTNDLSHPEQLRVARGVLTDIVSTVAAQHETVKVATCPSNHAAWRKGKTYLGRPGDDYGLDIHLSVQDILQRDPRFQHVSWVLPETAWDTITYVEEQGQVVAVTHGDDARPGQFPKWWQQQAGSNSQAHKATIIASGHYHHLRVQDIGINTDGRTRTWFQTSALDGGSAWWKNVSGEESQPGITTFLLHPDGWTDLQHIT